MLSVTRYAECQYAGCNYAECRSAECHYTQCCGVPMPYARLSPEANFKKILSQSKTIFIHISL